MNEQNQTAGMTATKQTKWGWGAVALVGLMAAATIEGSLVITAIGTAIFAIGAWLGGYMDETSQQLRKNLGKPAEAGERRAA